MEVGIGTRIKTIRTASGLRQIDLAERASLSTVALSHIERGISQPRASTIKALADALGCSPGALLETPGA